MQALRIFFGAVFYINLTLFFGYIMYLVWTMFYNELEYTLKKHPYFHDFPYRTIMKGLFILTITVLGYFGLIKLGMYIQDQWFPMVN